MKREIIKIDDNLCNGCGECIPNCHEGAIQIIDGKARLVSELMCDGLGACLSHCPTGAITIETKEAASYEEIAECGCPGSKTLQFAAAGIKSENHSETEVPSQLAQWPVQLHLVSPEASYFHSSDLIVAADCVAYALGNFHRKYLKGKSLAIACPKLDNRQDMYINKIQSLIDLAKVNTLTVMIMEVPCCGGLMQMVQAAAGKANRKIPVKSIVVSVQGEILEEEWV